MARIGSEPPLDVGEMLRSPTGKLPTEEEADPILDVVDIEVKIADLGNACWVVSFRNSVNFP